MTDVLINQHGFPGKNIKITIQALVNELSLIYNVLNQNSLHLIMRLKCNVRRFDSSRTTTFS